MILPVPALLGLNVDPLIPNPLKVPPVGVPDNVTEGELVQKIVGLTVKLTFGKPTTFVLAVAIAEQP
jgi:hypothetical protein